MMLLMARLPANPDKVQVLFLWETLEMTKMFSAFYDERIRKTAQSHNPC